VAARACATWPKQSLSTTPPWRAAETVTTPLPEMDGRLNAATDEQLTIAAAQCHSAHPGCVQLHSTAPAAETSHLLLLASLLDDQSPESAAPFNRAAAPRSNSRRLPF